MLEFSIFFSQTYLNTQNQRPTNNLYEGKILYVDKYIDYTFKNEKNDSNFILFLNTLQNFTLYQNQKEKIKIPQKSMALKFINNNKAKLLKPEYIDEIDNMMINYWNSTEILSGIPIYFRDERKSIFSSNYFHDIQKKRLDI